MVTEFPPVLLALSSASLLGRLHQSWLADTGFPVSSVTTYGVDAARWMREVPAGIALCDDRVLRHAAVRSLFAPPIELPVCRIVLVAIGAGAAMVPEEIPVCAVLEPDMESDTVVHQLRMLGAAQDHPLFLSSSDQQALFASYEGTIEPERDPSVQEEAAKHPRLNDPLTELLRKLQTESGYLRDRVTGLATSHVLKYVLTTLPALNQAATIAVVAIRARTAGASLKPDEQLARPMRVLAAGLRAHLRQDDLVCRLNGPAFAVVLSHPPDSAPQLARRLRDVLAAVERVALGESAQLTARIGLGFCAPGTAAAQPLARAWRAATE
jgi:GGDEF domain-containing protein